MSVPCSAFLRSEADFNGFSSRKYQTNLFWYLAAAFGSTRISSVYSIVDMAMMGQYPGPDGTATLTVAALWGKKQKVVGEYGYVKR